MTWMGAGMMVVHAAAQLVVAKPCCAAIAVPQICRTKFCYSMCSSRVVTLRISEEALIALAATVMLHSCLQEEKLVYVDDAEVPKNGRGWFHLAADSIDELHAFAAEINLSARAFHRGARHPHYDITEAQRMRAIGEGALPVKARDIVRITRQSVIPSPCNSTRNQSLQLPLFV